MPSPYQRIYNLKLKRNPSPAPDCTLFNNFVEQRARFRRTLHGFTPTSNGTFCEITLRIECASSGDDSINKLRRDLVAQFPNIIFEQFQRERS